MVKRAAEVDVSALEAEIEALKEARIAYEKAVMVLKK